MSSAFYLARLIENEPGIESLFSVEDMGFTSPCWLWQRKISAQGYGYYYVGGKTVRAHRYFFEQCLRPIAADSQIDHLCRVRRCVNPNHLEEVSSAENSRRASSTVLTEEKVLEIRCVYASGGVSQRELAAKHDVSQAHISGVIGGRFWATGEILHSPEKRGAGVRPPNTKLADDDVREIRRVYASGGTSYAKLGQDYGVCAETIHRVVKGTAHGSVKA